MCTSTGFLMLTGQGCKHEPDIASSEGVDQHELHCVDGKLNNHMFCSCNRNGQE